MPRTVTHMIPQPIEPLNIEELRFWLKELQEHAVFIKEGLPCERTDLIDEAEAFYQEFCMLIVRTERVTSERKFMELAADSCNTIREFFRFTRCLLEMLLDCQLRGHNFPLFLDHMAREAEYFLSMLEKMKDGKVSFSAVSKAQEGLFWLRITGDHAAFLLHLIDPSERGLINAACSFVKDFDDLYLQGRDIAGMLICHAEIPAFRRFIKDMRSDVLRFRDFIRAVHEMVCECKLLGLLTPVLSAHIQRETDHFLLILSMMDKDVIKNTCPAPPCEEREQQPPEAPLVHQPPATAAPEDRESFATVTGSEEDDEEEPPLIVSAYENGNTEPKKTAAVTPPPEPPVSGANNRPCAPDAPAPVNPPDAQAANDRPSEKHSKQKTKEAEAPPQKPKHKTTGRWPRPLGKPS